MSDLTNLIKYYKDRELEKIREETCLIKEIETLNLKLSEFRKQLKSDVSQKYYYHCISFMIDNAINIENDIIIGILPHKKDNRMLKVKCQLCGVEREVKSKLFFSDRPLKEGMCACRKYLPKKDTSYINTIRGLDIFIGLSEKSNGYQYIWVKCLKCGKYRKVIGEDYLNNLCINTCDHVLNNEEKLKQFDFSFFRTIIPYFNMNTFIVGDVLNNGEDTFLGYKEVHGHTFAYLQCNDCGKSRRMALSEFLRADKHTLAYSQCSCKNELSVKIGGIYGNLKVVSFDKDKKKYKCKCLCEKDAIVYREKYQLLTGISLSCGCLSKDLKSKYNCIDFIGKEYNNLIVKGFYKLKDIKTSSQNDLGVYWLCSCKLCGKKVIYPAKHIVNNMVTDCGCKNRRFFEDYRIHDFVDDLEITDIIRIRGEGTYWAVRCPFCENNFVRLASNIFAGHYKSCGCLKRSYGELLTLNILRKYKFNFREQVSFAELKNGTLRFDFLVERDNKYFLIEYDGLEHFSEKTQFGGKIENFERIQYNDNLKNEYAKFKGIPLLRIPYILDKEKLENMILDFIGGKNYV